MAIDGTGNIWMTASSNTCSDAGGNFLSPVFEFDNQGNALSPNATAANDYCGGYEPQFGGKSAFSGAQALAVDLDGSTIWVGNLSTTGASNTTQNITRLNSDGTVTQANYFTASLLEPNGSQTAICAGVEGLALDANDNLWATCQTENGVYGAISEISTVDGSAIGAQLYENESVNGGQYQGTGLGVLGGLSIDSNGNVWAVTNWNQFSFLGPIGINSTSDLYQIGTTPTNVVVPVISDHSTSGGTFIGTVITDQAGNVYAPSLTPGILSVLPANSSNSTAVTNWSYPLPTLADGGIAFGVPQLAIDGGSNIWGAAYGGEAPDANDSGFPGDAVNPSYLFQLSSTGAVLSPSNGSNVAGYTGTGGGGETQAILATNDYSELTEAGIAVDESGNVWVANGSVTYSFLTDVGAAEQLVEFIGIAPPVLTPMATALRFGDVGVSPQVKTPVQLHK
jgi:hypothetical protein